MLSNKLYLAYIYGLN